MTTAYTHIWSRMKLLAMHCMPLTSWLHLDLRADHTSGSHQDFSNRKHENEVWVSHAIFRKHVKLLRRLSWLPACFQASSATSKVAWILLLPLEQCDCSFKALAAKTTSDAWPILLEEGALLGELVNEDIRPTGMWNIVSKCNGHHCFKRYIFSRKLNKTARLVRLGIALRCPFNSVEWGLLKIRFREFLGLCTWILGHICFVKE